MTSANTEASNEVDSALLQKSYAHELIMNSEGRVTGGSLNAMVEQERQDDDVDDHSDEAATCSQQKRSSK